MRALGVLLVLILLCAMPPARAQETVIFPAGKNSVELPTKFQFPHIFVRVDIGQRGLDFILDSGASGIAVDAEVARQLGLSTSLPTSVVMAQRIEEASGVLPELRIGDLVMHDVSFETIPWARDEQAGLKTVGLLGYDFLRAVALKIDYKNARVTAVPAAQFTPPPLPPPSDVIPLRIINRLPMVTMTINGAMADRMIVDTGAATDLMLFNYFVRRSPDAISPNVATPLGFTGSFIGVGGHFDAKGYRLRDVDLGKFHLANFGALYAVSPGSYGWDADGVIGPGILAHFTVYLDYAHGAMYLTHQAGQ